MPRLTQAVTFSWRDAKGFVGRTRYYISGDGGTNTPTDYNSCGSTLLAALKNLTNAKLSSTAGPVLSGLITLTYGTNAQYASEWMKAVYTFSNDDGVQSRFKIPAPLIALCEADGVTIINDGTSAPVVAYVAAIKTADASGTYISDAAGRPYTHFEGGIVRLGRQPRRFNERIKSAKLVAGEGE